MKNERTRLLMVPVRVMTYEDDEGNTVVGRVEHPSSKTIEQVVGMSLDNPGFCLYSGAVGNAKDPFGVGFRVFGNEYRKMPTLEAHAADVIFHFTASGHVLCVKDRLGGSNITSNLEEALEIISSRFFERKRIDATYNDSMNGIPDPR